MTFHYWKPARRTRSCAAESCEAREHIRTDAIRINARQPISLCARHWREYQTVSGLTFTQLAKPP